MAFSFSQRSGLGRRTTYSAQLAHGASYAYLAPAAVFVVGFIYFGIAANVVYSTWDWNGISPSHVDVGGGNFVGIATDKVFWQALGNTLLFSVLAVSIQLALGFLLAILVRTKTQGTGLLRTLLFVPVVLSPAVVATSYRLLLTPNGEFNQLLGLFGIHSQVAWVADPKIALFTLAAINIWQYTGYSFVIYDAAIGQIDASIIEAAKVDGVSTRQMMQSIVFPMLRGSHFILIVLGFIGGLKTFEIVFLITGGGPGTATEFLTTYIYREAITQFHAGYGAALSLVLAVVAMIFAVVQVRLTQRSAS